MRRKPGACDISGRSGHAVFSRFPLDGRQLNRAVISEGGELGNMGIEYYTPPDGNAAIVTAELTPLPESVEQRSSCLEALNQELESWGQDTDYARADIRVEGRRVNFYLYRKNGDFQKSSCTAEMRGCVRSIAGFTTCCDKMAAKRLADPHPSRQSIENT